MTYTIKTHFGTISCENQETMIALRCYLYDVVELNSKAGYDSMAAEVYDWINQLKEQEKKAYEG